MTSSVQRQRRGPSARTLMVVGLLGLILLIIGITVFGREPAVKGADQTDPQLVAEGQLVYRAQCANCHGANLEGQPNWQAPLPSGLMPAPPHDASGHTWHHSDESLFTTVKFGGQATSPPGYRNAMPAFGNLLTDNEIWAVLAYIKSTWPVELQEAQQQGHE